MSHLVPARRLLFFPLLFAVFAAPQILDGLQLAFLGG
jgi:hypothetical protein